MRIPTSYNIAPLIYYLEFHMVTGMHTKVMVRCAVPKEDFNHLAEKVLLTRGIIQSAAHESFVVAKNALLQRGLRWLARFLRALCARVHTQSISTETSHHQRAMIPNRDTSCY